MRPLNACRAPSVDEWETDAEHDVERNTSVNAGADWQVSVHDRLQPTFNVSFNGDSSGAAPHHRTRRSWSDRDAPDLGRSRFRSPGRTTHDDVQHDPHRRDRSPRTHPRRSRSRSASVKRMLTREGEHNGEWGHTGEWDQSRRHRQAGARRNSRSRSRSRSPFKPFGPYQGNRFAQSSRRVVTVPGTIPAASKGFTARKQSRSGSGAKSNATVQIHAAAASDPAADKDVDDVLDDSYLPGLDELQAADHDGEHGVAEDDVDPEVVAGLDAAENVFTLPDGEEESYVDIMFVSPVNHASTAGRCSGTATSRASSTCCSAGVPAAPARSRPCWTTAGWSKALTATATSHSRCDAVLTDH